MSFLERMAQGGNISKEGPAPPGSFAPSRELRAGWDAKGWLGQGPPPFVGRCLGMEIASGGGGDVGFLFFLPKQPSCVFWRPVNHSSSSGKRGEEYMIQPSKNAGHLGMHMEEARNQPQAGGCLRLSHRVHPSLLGWELIPQPYSRPGFRELGSPAERRAKALSHCHETTLFQQVRLLPRFQNFPHLLS